MKVTKDMSKEVFAKIQEFIEQMSSVQESLLTYLDEEDDENDSNFHNLVSVIDEKKILENKHQIKSFYHLLLSLFNNHNRSNNFLNKMDTIIKKYKKDLFNHFNYNELFSIFRQNKRFALTLFGKNEINDHLDSELLKLLHINNDQKIDENKFEENIKKGENDEYICQLMRNDEIDEFVQFIEKKNISRNSKIYSNEYESHQYLNENHPTLIEYSSFFGSLQIFKHLQLNDVRIESTLWITIIHGRNNELFHIPEEDLHLNPPNKNFQSILNESIICQHNEYYDYIKTNLLNDKIPDKSSAMISCLKSFNFQIMEQLLQDDDFAINDEVFIALLANDYPYFVQLLIDSGLVDVSHSLTIQNVKGAESSYPLYFAIKDGTSEIVELFLKQPKINLKIHLPV